MPDQPPAPTSAKDNFVHLHVHTEYSMLDGAARIGDLFTRAAEMGMPALATTDHGYLFGAYEFWKAGRRHGIKPIFVRMVYQCAKAVKIPIIGCGGIVKVEDVVEYMLAGASAVLIGYLIFRNPSGLIAIIEGLEQWCAKRGFARVADLTGAMIDEAPRETYAAAAAPIG